MNSDTAEIRRLGRPGDLGWVVMAHGEVYAAEFGWDVSFEALVARIVADYASGHDPAREAAWIAEIHGRRAGCVFCVDAGERTAQLRILLVDPAARGYGLGGRLVDQCVAFACQAGYQRIKLWTNHPLAAARAVYLSRGFTLVSQEPHHSFGADLVGQVYELGLRQRLMGLPGATRLCAMSSENRRKASGGRAFFGLISLVGNGDVTMMRWTLRRSSWCYCAGHRMRRRIRTKSWSASRKSTSPITTSCARRARLSPMAR